MCRIVRQAARPLAPRRAGPRRGTARIAGSGRSNRAAAGLRSVAQRLVARRGQRLMKRIERWRRRACIVGRAQRAVGRRDVGDHHQPLIIAQPMFARVVQHPPGDGQCRPGPLVGEIGRRHAAMHNRRRDRIARRGSPAATTTATARSRSVAVDRLDPLQRRAGIAAHSRPRMPSDAASIASPGCSRSARSQVSIACS